MPAGLKFEWAHRLVDVFRTQDVVAQQNLAEEHDRELENYLNKLTPGTGGDEVTLQYRQQENTNGLIYVPGGVFTGSGTLATRLFGLGNSAPTLTLTDDTVYELEVNWIISCSSLFSGNTDITLHFLIAPYTTGTPTWDELLPETPNANLGQGALYSRLTGPSQRHNAVQRCVFTSEDLVSYGWTIGDDFMLGTYIEVGSISAGAVALGTYQSVLRKYVGGSVSRDTF